MSGPTIRIGEPVGFPEVTAVNDVGPTIDITNINDLDLSLLGNQKKISISNTNSAPPTTTTINTSGNNELKEVDAIEFVNLEDTNVTYDVKPPASTGDTIKILRETTTPTLNLNPSPPKVEPTTFSPTASATSSAPTTSSWLPKSSGLSSWFGGGNMNTTSNSNETRVEPVATYLTPEQESVKKMEGLTLLERMDRKGVGGNKMTMANSLDEINSEVARRKDSKNLESSLRFQRHMMTTVVSGMEFLNNRYDPLGVSLDGWSEQINENIEDYDEIFEELYDKYKDKTKVAPEVRLVMSLGLSAAMCHLTNTMFKSRMPGMDDILRNNPDLARQMARAAAEQAVGPGFANFMSMAPGGGGPTRPMPMPMPMNEPPSVPQQPPPPVRPMDIEPPTISFIPPMGSGIGAPIPSTDPRDRDTPVTARREMRGPTGVDDILRTLETNGQVPNRTTPQPAIDAEDLGSVTSAITTDTQRRNGLSRRRKPTVAQPMGSTLTLNV